MLRTVITGLRFRAARLALSALAITAGVAFVAGTLVLGASMRQAFYHSFAAGARNVDAAVSPAAAAAGKQRPRAASGPALPLPVLAAVRRVPGVAAADGRVLGQAALIGASGKVIANNGRPGAGISVAADPALRGFTIAAGRVPSGPGELVVDTATAADEHFRLGQQVRVARPDGSVRGYRLTGTIDIGASRSFGNATVAGFTPPAAFRVTGSTGFDQVVARAKAGVSQAALAASLRALPALRGDQVQTGAQLATAEAAAAVHFTTQFTAAILVFAIISLVVAAIVIYNTFTILTAQRTRELALLRCVGAGRRQVFTGVLAESLVVGAVASAAGVVAGLGLGWALERLFAAFGAQIPAGALVLTPATVAISLAAGMAVTLLSALLPARAATRVAPVAALGGGAEPRITGRIGWLRAVVAAVCAAAGLLATYAGMHNTGGTGGFVAIAAGGCVFFVAVLAAGPLIVPPVTAFLGWLPAALFGVPGRLAAANARRNPHRVAATTAALTIGITLMTVFTVVASSAQASSIATIRQHYPFAYTVSASPAAAATVPLRVLRDLRHSPALTAVTPYYQQQVTVGGQPEPVGALAASGLRLISPPLVAGSLAALRPGTAAVDSGQARALGTRQGGTVTVRTPDAGVLRLRVVAEYNGSDSPLPAVLVTVPDYLRGFRPAGPAAVYANAAPGAGTPAARAAVTRAAGSDPLLSVSTIADYTSALTARVNQVLTLFGALLGLAILIALLGIASTLTLSVIERARESALLRALGLTRGQLRLMLLAEALLMALLGVMLGAALGAGFGWAMVEAFIRSAGGGVMSVPFAPYIALGAAAGLAAAVLPARRAARASVVAAMAES
jgi:putative ABC transport system permease protein